MVHKLTIRTYISWHEIAQRKNHLIMQLKSESVTQNGTQRVGGGHKTRSTIEKPIILESTL